MTYIIAHNPEIARAACKVAWLETLHEGHRNGTVPWHAWNDELGGQDLIGITIDESHRALVGRLLSEPAGRSVRAARSDFVGATEPAGQAHRGVRAADAS